MQLLDEGLTGPTSNTTPTVYIIFTLKNSEPVYTVQSINSFCHFINSNVAKFQDQMPFLMPNHCYDEDQYFHQDTIFR